MQIRRISRLAFAATLLLTAGCASWRVPTYDFSRLRDPRAADIDSRLGTPTSGEDAAAR